MQRVGGENQTHMLYIPGLSRTLKDNDSTLKDNDSVGTEGLQSHPAVTFAFTAGEIFLISSIFIS